MRFKLILCSNIVLISILAFGCSSPATPTETNQTANVPTANINSNTQTDQPANANEDKTLANLQTEKTPDVQTTNQAPTLSAVYKAYCVALNKKDEAAVRKVYSSDTLQSLEKDMKDDGKTSLVEFLVETEPIKDPSKCAVRNEKINGDSATAEIRSENMPNGIEIVFVKENGEWKITNKIAGFDKK